jgi:hypothetical protein
MSDVLMQRFLPSSSAGDPQPAARLFFLLLSAFWRNDGLPGSDKNSFYRGDPAQQ